VTALDEAIKARFPRAPGLYREEAARRLAGRDVPAPLLGLAIDAMVESVIRHQLTDYDALRSRHGLTPEEAAQAVAEDIADMLADWRGH
jgi:hypothetical protein